MVQVTEVLEQLRRLNIKVSLWNRAEVKELAGVLVPGETIKAAVFGWYDNGLGLLCCTDQRVLLMDKKLFFFKMEDLRYDKIAEIKFLNHLFDSMVILTYPGQTLEFRSLNQRALRQLMAYVQSSILAMNQQIMALSNIQMQTLPRDMSHETTPMAQVTEPPKLWPSDPALASGMSYEMPAVPDDLTEQATVDLHLSRNPYAPTNKFLRRRLPLVGMAK